MEHQQRLVEARCNAVDLLRECQSVLAGGPEMEQRLLGLGAAARLLCVATFGMGQTHDLGADIRDMGIEWMFEKGGAR